MSRFSLGRPSLETLFWILASIVGFGVFLFFAPTFFNIPSGTPTPIARAVATSRPTLTPISTATPLPLPVAAKGQSPVPLPTLAAGAQAYSFVATPGRTGWIVSGDENPHWGDRNIHAGTYKGQTFQSLLSFDIPTLAPGSKILYAEVELTGLSRNNLGTSGTWTLQLLPFDLAMNWTGRSSSDFKSATVLGKVGSALSPADLAEGQINQFAFSADQLTKLETALSTTGRVAFRLDGPLGTDQNLFTWEGGDRDPKVGIHPMLRIIAIPGQYVFITNTPTPENVLTAAAALVQSTANAQQYGTPTPFPRLYATVPPNVAITPVPTPANLETATARAAYATAVALTTGTFTPTPLNFVTVAPTPTTTPTPTATPTPPFVTLSQFTPIPSPSPKPTEVSLLEYRKTPIPKESGLIGKITFMTNREGEKAQVWVMESNGTPIGKFTSDEYYRIAGVHDLYSQDYLFHLDFGKDDRNLWLISVFDIAKGTFTPLIQEDKRAQGIGVYHPAWSPAGDKIAFVSERTGSSEIYVYDLKTQATARLTNTFPDPITKHWASNKHPSWSPDGKQIIFSSNRDTISRWQVWIMNADGGGLHNFSPSPYSDWDPVWIKR